FFSSRRRHTRSKRDWSSDVCSSDLRKLITGIIVGASVGGLVTLFNQEARDYAKEGLYDLKDKATNYIENPSTAIIKVKDTVHQKIGRASCRERVTSEKEKGHEHNNA